MRQRPIGLFSVERLDHRRQPDTPGARIGPIGQIDRPPHPNLALAEGSPTADQHIVDRLHAVAIAGKAVSRPLPRGGEIELGIAGFAGRADEYIEQVCSHILPALAEEGLVDAVDAFCEHLAFSPAQVERVFQAAQRLGLPVKLHAEQLSSLHGSSLAARYGALSADHLEFMDESDAMAMAEAGTVAVLLPGAFFVLRETQLPPMEALRKHGVNIAIASDLNPGTSPALSLRLMLNMACTAFRLTPEEALAGVTLNAARALGMADSHGSLEAGKVADFVA